MKKIGVFSLLFMTWGFFLFSSCVDSSYNLDEDNLDKNVYFSPDGITIPIGGVDTAYFADLHTSDSPLEAGENVTYTIPKLFDEKTIDVFFSEENPGDFALSIVMDVRIADASTDLALILTPKVILSDRTYANIPSLEPITIRNNTTNEIKLEIKEEFMSEMQEASDLEFELEFQGRIEQFKPEDLFILKDMVITKKGGINLEFD